MARGVRRRKRLENDAFHIARMWAKLKIRAIDNTELEDLPDEIEPFGLPRADELQKWLDNAREATKNAFSKIKLERKENIW